MLDLEWKLVGLGNLVDPLAALDCHRFSLLLKASRISGNIQAESRKFVSYKKTCIQWHFTYRIKTNLYLNKKYSWGVSFWQGTTALPCKLEPHTTELTMFENSNFADYPREEFLYIKKQLT